MMRTLALMIVLACLGAATAAAQPSPPEDQGDYEPSSRTWNGLASLVGIAEGLGYEVETVAALEWGELDERDVLVLIYPLQRVDPARLYAFIQAGGYVVIADDFGDAGDALSRLSILRATVAAPRAERFQHGLRYAPIATVITPHPITADVTEVVTNHPAVLTQVEGATTLVGFPGGEAVVVAGERGTGRFVVVSDPSIFINRMLQFPGNLRVTTGILRWLSRGGRADRVVLLRGDVPMYGDPRPFIDDAGAGEVGRTVADLNRWLDEGNEYLLTPPAMRAIAIAATLLLAGVALVVFPVRRRSSDGRWLRLERPGRRDDIGRAVAAYNAGQRNFLLPAAVLRDVVQEILTRLTGHPDPLYSIGERDLIAQVSAARGPAAGEALTRVYARLRALPSRSQAAAPWGGGQVSAPDFRALYDDVTELCRKLGEEIS